VKGYKQNRAIGSLDEASVECHNPGSTYWTGGWVGLGDSADVLEKGLLGSQIPGSYSCYFIYIFDLYPGLSCVYVEWANFQVTTVLKWICMCAWACCCSGQDPGESGQGCGPLWGLLPVCVWRLDKPASSAWVPDLVGPISSIAGTTADTAERYMATVMEYCYLPHVFCYVANTSDLSVIIFTCLNLILLRTVIKWMRCMFNVCIKYEMLDILHETVFHTQDLTFLQWWCWDSRPLKVTLGDLFLAFWRNIVKVKLSRCRPGQALGGSRRLRLQNF
jgi:hypothetical protein